MVSGHIRSNLIGYIALFFAVGLGSAWAATELERNEVKSKHIGNGQVKNADLANDAVSSPKVANGSLLGEDFASGELPQGPRGERGLQGEQGIQGERGIPGERGLQGPAGSARAYGRVAEDGTLSRSANVVGVTHTAATASYDIQLPATIDACQAVLITEEDDNGNGTSAAGEAHSYVEWNSTSCTGNKMNVKTFVDDGDDTDDVDPPTDGADNLVPEDEPFAFMVP